MLPPAADKSPGPMNSASKGVVPVAAALALAAGGLALLTGVMAQRDLRAVDEGRMDPAGRSATRDGWARGRIGIALAFVALLACAVFVVFMGVGKVGP